MDVVNTRKLCVHAFMKSQKHLLEWMQSVISPNISKVADYTPATLVYWIVHGLQDYPKCARKGCDNLVVMNVSTFAAGFNKFCCRSCATSDEETQAASRRTSLEKYGVDHFTNREKAKQTTFEHFGCICGFQSPNALQSMKDRYEVEFYMQSPDFKPKSITVMLEKYGVKNIQQLPEIRTQSQQTAIGRYGSANNHAKYLQTMAERYGVSSNFQLKSHKKLLHERKDEIWEKKRQTLLSHYGTPCTPTLKYMFEGKLFDSGPELAYFIWLRDQKKSFIYHPTIWFEYVFQGETHKYFPDFIVEGQAVEIKGNQFFEGKDPTKSMVCPFDRSKDAEYEAKHQCMIANGVKVLTSQDYHQYEQFVETKYGKGYLQQFKRKCCRSDFSESK